LQAQGFSDPLFSLHRLNHPVVIITGGAGGLATALATVFRENGAEVFSPGRDDLDVRSSADVDRYFKGFERIDVLINNAGITGDKLFARLEEADWDAVLDTNLKGAFNMLKAVQRSILKQKGARIINISSVIGLIGNAGQANYAASKAGLIGFTKSLAREFAGRGVTANCICPGFIATDMTHVLNDQVKEEILKKIPLGDLGSAEDISAAALYLASPQARYVTGQVLTVDGGMVM
jgi:3-oxoacyl-[acyl-carrier protein] reductase